MIDLPAVFVMGAMSSAHCVGMCGGFAAAVGAGGARWSVSVARQLVYSLGRITTYAFLGSLCGAAGLALASGDSTFARIQQGFSIVAGVAMFLVGISVLGLFRVRGGWLAPIVQLVAPIYRHYLQQRTWSGLFIAGIANGFLPCGLVYSFLAFSVAAGDVFAGAAVMIAFGLGTIPVMVAAGLGSRLLTHGARVRIYQVASCAMIIAGVLTVWRAWPTRTHACCSGPVEVIGVSTPAP